MPASDAVGDPEVPSPRNPAVEDMLAAVTESAVSLLGQSSRPPSRLRVQAGDVVVEAQWAVEAPLASGNGSSDPNAPAGAAVRNEEASSPDVAADRHLVCAPTVGSFYRSPEPGAAPFVEVGDHVAAGQQVGIVEVMKLMMPVKVEVDGRIVEILTDDGANVEHGEPLFAVAPG